MSDIQIILLTLSILALIEGIIIALFPKKILKWALYFAKNQPRMLRAGMIEIAIALILFAISLLLE